MNMQLSGLIKTCSIACVIALTFGACSDTWDEHYKVDYSKTTATLWDQLSSKPSFSDFKEVLDSVRVSNGYRSTDVRYSQLLQQQFYTVFAPVNGTFNKDSLLDLCSTVAGNKSVEQRFVLSHLSRNPYSLSGYVDTTNVGQKALMVNGKYLPFVNGTLANIALIDSISNISARNGLLHGVEGRIPYRKNIYEEVVENSEFQRIGNLKKDSIGMGGFLFKYQKDSLDALASIEAGTDDLGNTVYIDSVMIRVNSLIGSFGQINSEDSTYWMVAPTMTAWNNAYKKVSSYFNYPTNNPTEADSLKRFWTNFMLMRDMFYNKNTQSSVNDSMTSVAYSYRSPLMHVYHNPYAAGGILNDVNHEISASNGKIFVTNTWPFDVKKIFFEPIVVEAERESTVATLNNLLTNSNFRQASTVPNVGGKISSNGLIELTPIVSTNRTDVTLNVPGTLSGKYDVCIIICPNIMSWTNLASLNKKFRFQAFLNYKSAAGGDVQLSCRGGEGQNLSFFTSDPTKLDTITLTTVTFPSANYKQNIATVKLRLWSMQIKAAEVASYTHTVNLDCIYLKPRD